MSSNASDINGDVLAFQLDEGAAAPGARIEDDDIEIAECAVDLIEQPVDVRGVAHVAIEGDFRLDCGAAPATIDNPQSNRATFFDMQLTLPGRIPPGASIFTLRSRSR